MLDLLLWKPGLQQSLSHPWVIAEVSVPLGLPDCLRGARASMWVTSVSTAGTKVPLPILPDAWVGEIPPVCVGPGLWCWTPSSHKVTFIQQIQRIFVVGRGVGTLNSQPTAL